MANNAVLSVVDGSSERDLRMADYFVPLFWLACLSPEDELVKEQLDEDDADDYRLYVDVSPATALKRFQTRSDALEAILGNIPGDHREIRDAWIELLLRETRTLRFDVTEILGMTNEGEAEFRQATSYFESPTSESGAAIVAMTCIKDVIAGGAHSDPIDDYLWGYAHP